MLVVVIVPVVLANLVPLGADEAPLPAKSLVGTILAVVSTRLGGGQRLCVCIRIRVRDGFGI